MTTSETTSTHDSARAPGCWPCLSYQDASAALEYLNSVLGFERICAYPGEGERAVAHAEMSWPGGGGIMLGSPRPQDDPERIEPGRSVIYLAADSVLEIYQRVQSAGWFLTRELVETDYGSTDIGFRDPEGNRWNIGTYRGEGF